MLSILLPTYDRDMLPLVEVLHQQCIEAAYPFEILVFDDASHSHWNPSNEKINSWPHCQFISHTENKGRAANRNALATAAKGTHFLFLDGDMMPQHADFIPRYLKAIQEHHIIFGGIAYQTEKPTANFRLRWIYGKKREEIPMPLALPPTYASSGKCLKPYNSIRRLPLMGTKICSLSKELQTRDKPLHTLIIRLFTSDWKKTKCF